MRSVINCDGNIRYCLEPTDINPVLVQKPIGDKPSYYLEVCGKEFPILPISSGQPGTGKIPQPLREGEPLDKVSIQRIVDCANTTYFGNFLGQRPEDVVTDCSDEECLYFWCSWTTTPGEPWLNDICQFDVID